MRVMDDSGEYGCMIHAEDLSDGHLGRQRRSIRVQLIQIAGFWKRHPVVTPEIAALFLLATLLIAAGRVPELALKTPVGLVA